MPMPGRCCAAAALCVLLGGCNFQYENLSAGQGEVQRTFWSKPANGRWLCMAVKPGTPVYQSVNMSNLIGYTRDVVAIYGPQSGKWVMVVHYNGLLGWVDGTKLSLYSVIHPGHTCIVPDSDMQQRPIFQIQ